MLAALDDNYNGTGNIMIDFQAVQCEENGKRKFEIVGTEDGFTWGRRQRLEIGIENLYH